MGRVSMSIKIVCKCSRAYWVPDDKGGKRLACKACGAAITVPAAQPAAQHLVPNAGEARPRPKHQHRADKPTAVPRRLPDEIRNKAIAAGQALASNPCCSKLDFFQYFLCRPLQALADLRRSREGQIPLAQASNQVQRPVGRLKL